MSASPPQMPVWRRHGVALALFAAALVLLALGARVLLAERRQDDGLLQVNGRIEGERISIAPKLAGRVAELLVHEGDAVKAGQVLVRLDDQAVRARLAQAQAAHATLQAQLAAQDSALAVLRGETGVARQAARLRIAAAEAELHRADAARQQDERDQARARDLSAQGFVGPQALERATLALRLSGEQRDAAHAMLEQARQALRDAELGPLRVHAREAEQAATRAQLQQAAAAVAEAQAALDDLTLRAPAAGTVTSRSVHLGEVVNAGTPLLELTDLGQLYLKGYVPETQIGRVRRGMAAQIHVDAYPGRPFAATLRYVSARAEFTPKEVQTVDERVKLVYEVRLYADQNPDGRLNPGQPADGLIRWREGSAWRTPKH